MAPVNEPFSCPNRIEFDQRLRQGAAIDGDEGLAPALRAALDGARHQFLADAKFALDQDGDVGLRCPLGEAQRARHRLGLGHDVAKAEFAGAATRGAAQFVLERIDTQRVLDRHLEPFGADRLNDEVDRARPHGGNDRFNRTVRGLHDHRRGDLAPAHLSEHAHAVEIRHHEIENDETDREPVADLEPRHRGLA